MKKWIRAADVRPGDKLVGRPGMGSLGRGVVVWVRSGSGGQEREVGIQLEAGGIVTLTPKLDDRVVVVRG